MDSDCTNEECVRFTPPEFHGLLDVKEVAIYPDRIEVQTAGQWVSFRFGSFGRRQENVLMSWMKRLFGRIPRSLLVGEREFCTRSRYVAFFTNPKLVIYTPPDHDALYSETYIYRINAMLRMGGYITADLS